MNRQYEQSTCCTRRRLSHVNIIFRALGYRPGDPLLTREEVLYVLNERKHMRGDTISGLAVGSKVALEKEESSGREVDLRAYPGLLARKSTSP